jgi:hypothetical protein
MATKKKTVTPANTRTDSGDAATTKRMRDHISNENDVITTEDIRNAKTADLDETPETTKAEDENAESNDELLKKKIRDNEDNDIDTSWNILQSQ